MVSRWFSKNRGLALGIVSMGSGLGTLFIVPGNERLIDAFNWSGAFLICGSIAGVLMVISALFLRPAPQSDSSSIMKEKPISQANDGNRIQFLNNELTLSQSIKDPRFLLLNGAFFLFFLSIQIIMVHLVNYATDTGIDPIVAASFISIIGAVSIAGRFSMGVSAERLDVHNTLILTRVLLVVSFICILFTQPLWSFYLFAVLFGLPYGGEIPQIPLFIGKYFGIKKMATLVGISTFVMAVGGALGAWAAGRIFDTMHDYRGAFIVGLLSALGSLIMILILKKKRLK